MNRVERFRMKRQNISCAQTGALFFCFTLFSVLAPASAWATACSPASSIQIAGSSIQYCDSGSVIGTALSVTGASGADSVGIGTAAPTVKLNVSGTTGLPATTGTSVTTGDARFTDSSNIALDLNTWNTSPYAYTLQVHDITAQGANYSLALQPNGGNVGIGTTSPYSTLSNNGTNIVGSDGVGFAANTGLDWTTGGGGYVAGFYNSGTGPGVAVKVNSTSSSVNALDVSSGTSQGSAGTPLFNVKASGNVSIGTTSPSRLFSLQGGAAGSNTYISLMAGGAEKTVIGDEEGASPKRPFIVYDTAASAYRLVIDASGNVGIDTTTTSSYTLTVNGTIGAQNWYSDTSGNLYPNTVIYASDRRLKTDIKPITDALDKLATLNPVTFRWDQDANKKYGFTGDDRQHIGLIAQDVEKVFPETVITDAKGIKRVDYPALVSPLVEALKEQQAEMAQLKARLDVDDAALATIPQLKAQIDSSKTDLAVLKTMNDTLQQDNETLREAIAAVKAAIGSAI